MKLRLLLAVLLAASCTSGQPYSQGPRGPDVGPDLDALVTAVTTIHPAPFASIREEAWRERVEDLRRQARSLPPEAFRVEIARLADLGDHNGHGGVFPTDQPPSTRMLALRVHLFPEGFHVVDAVDKSLVGMKLVDTPDLGRLRRVVPGDNYNTESARLSQYVVAPSFYGRINNGPALIDSRHQRHEITPTMTPAEWAEWAGVDVPQIPLALPRPSWAPKDDPWWSVRRGDALVVGYERVVAATDDGRTARTFADRVRADVARSTPRVVVVDIRRNPGGDIGTALPITNLVRELVAKKVPVRVLVSWSTYSAAAMAFARLREEVPALRFYGEPTGGGSFTYGNPQAVTLPVSGIVVHVPSAAAGTPGVEAIVPDVVVAQSWPDWRRGRDTVLERALAG